MTDIFDAQRKNKFVKSAEDRLTYLTASVSRLLYLI